MAPSPALPPNLAYKEPLRKWQIVQSFDTADDCEDSLGRFFEQARAKRALNMLEPAYWDYMFALCIASDDPRSNENWLPARAADEVLLSVSRVNQVKLGNPGMECCLHFGRFP